MTPNDKVRANRAARRRRNHERRRLREASEARRAEWLNAWAYLHWLYDFNCARLKRGLPIHPLTDIRKAERMKYIVSDRTTQEWVDDYLRRCHFGSTARTA
jgi:hypothetical protein